MARRVVCTGIGALTPLGNTAADSWRAAVAGRSGVAEVTAFDTSSLPVHIGGEVRGFDPLTVMDRREARRMDRFIHLAMAAAAEAVADSGLQLERIDRDRAGVMCGTGIGGITTLCEQHETLLTRGPDRVSPFFIPGMIANMAPGMIAIRYGLRGPSATTVTACASSGHAVGDAYQRIRYGEADVMLAGGSEAVLVPLCFAGFTSMKALSLRNDEPELASRPFDLARDGFVMGEGAGMLVLEERDQALARCATIYAEIVGYGATADAYHIVEPAPDGGGAALAIRAALRDGQVAPERVGYINAHATGTPKGDISEARAIREVFGDLAGGLAVSSTKSMTGHLLGAAGAVESIFTMLALRDEVLPPTINLTEPDPEIDLDCIPQRARPQAVDVALSNSFGFGGQNVTLAFSRHDLAS